MIVCHDCRGELHSPTNDTDAIPYLRYNINHCRDAKPRVFSPTGFNINSPLTPGFESGFTGFAGLQRTSSVLAQRLFVEYLLFTLLFADALRIGEKPCNENSI